MRKRLGPDFAITIRMAGNDFVPGSNTSLEIPEFAKTYEKAGVDGINVTGGWHESRVPQLPMEAPRGGYIYLADNIKQAVSVPIIASNRVPDPHQAEQILRDNMADMINLGRVLLADPYWPKKAQEGRADEIRPCIACSQRCLDELFSGRPVGCLMNARTGFEAERNIVKTRFPKKIMIIGAGPGGLEAAIRAAEAGHKVELYEKENQIGGQLKIAGVPPQKSELWEIIRFYNKMLDKYKINLFLKTSVDIDFIKNKKPDHVIVAEGAEPSVPPISGIDSKEIVSAWDVLLNNPELGKKIAVIGGGAVGLEVAHFLGAKGTISPEVLHFLFRYSAESPETLMNLLMKGNKDITIFEMLPKAGQGVGKSTKWVLLGNIEFHNIDMITGAKVISIKDGAVAYEKEGHTESLKFDNIINAVGSKSVRKISDVIQETGIPFSIIGDCVRPAQINDAIHKAFLAIMEIEKSAILLSEYFDNF